MVRRKLASCILAAALTAAVTAGARADEAEDIARHRHAQAIEALMASTGDGPLRKFADDELAPDYRNSLPGEKVIDHLREIRDAMTGFGGLLVDRPEDGAVRMLFALPSGERALVFRMQTVVPYLITALDLDAGSAPGPGLAVKPITWDTLAARVDEEAKNGFSGSVYIVRGGKVVLAKGYGLADRDLGIRNGAGTIYAIGSTPIDFTRAAILKLEEQGKLQTSDPITKYFDAVPADKQSITIDELMSGASGLPNVHHIPGVIADPDLTWVDRDTVIQRILGQPLLFVPGTGAAHSHSAWVVLAALVEKASGQPYGDYVAQTLFKPAGMTATFLHEGLRKTPDSLIAIGYQGQSAGPINSPKYWGRTSWLVMGSGGMVSTAEDLGRFFTAVHGGVLLSKKEMKKYTRGGLFVGGDDRGYLCMHGERGHDMFVMCSNAHSGSGDLPSAVGDALARMVLGTSPGR